MAEHGILKQDRGPMLHRALPDALLAFYRSKVPTHLQLDRPTPDDMVYAILAIEYPEDTP
jgi:hypothetical protein